LFRSAVIDQAIENTAQKIHDPTLACLFRNTLPNTLDTTVSQFTTSEKVKPLRTRGGVVLLGLTACPFILCQAPDTFVITGDITAMWLRDSTNQVLPYLRWAGADPKVAMMIRGLIRRQAMQVKIVGQ